MVGNIVLRFKAEPSTQRDIRPYAPIVLDIDPGVEKRDRRAGYSSSNRIFVGPSAVRGRRLASRDIIHGRLIRSARSEDVGAIELRIRAVCVRDFAQASAELDDVFAVYNRSVILYFVVVRIVELGTLAVAARIEESFDVNSRGGTLRALIRHVVQELKARFVDNIRAKGVSVPRLQGLLSFEGVERLRRQREGTNALILLIIPPVLVAHGERIVFRELIIKPRAQIRSRQAVGNSLVKGCEALRSGIEYAGVHHLHVVDAPALRAEEDGRFLG